MSMSTHIFIGEYSPVKATLGTGGTTAYFSCDGDDLTFFKTAHVTPAHLRAMVEAFNRVNDVDAKAADAASETGE
jgi:hypothetical protein